MSVKVEHSVVAKCKPEHAWEKFQKMEEWSWWNRAVGSAKWSSGQPWQQGSRFALELAYPKRLALKPVVTESGAPQVIAWKDDGGGLSSVMSFRFEAQADGTTTLKGEAELSGWKTVLSGDSLKQGMAKAFEEWLGALKTEAEKIAREELARS